MKDIKYPCRIYAYEMNPSGRDDYRFQKKVNDDDDLFLELGRIRDEFHDNYTELDKYVYLADENEERLNVRPSSVLKEFGGSQEKAKSCQIRKCKFCFHFVDREMNYCKDFGKTGCGKYITVDDFWKSDEGKRKIKESEEEERKFWKSQPPEKREFHELYEQYSDFLNKWWKVSEEEKGKLDLKMDELIPRLKELGKKTGMGFTDWRPGKW